MPADKNQIRREIRHSLRDLGVKALKEASERISERLMSLELPGDPVLGFWPLTASEPDIRPALREWHRRGIAVCLPRVTGGVAMGTHAVGDFATLVSSEFGVLEPEPVAHPEIGLEQIKIALVPGVAFSASGARLGRGGGHYDRFLARLEPTTHTLGVAFHCQMRADIPLERHDVRVDEVLFG